MHQKFVLRPAKWYNLDKQMIGRPDKPRFCEHKEVSQ